MTVVSGKSVPASLLEETTKCRKKLEAVQKKKNISLDSTGDKKTNAMLAFLKCQAKATKRCSAQDKEYTLCHQSFMGVGSYKGAKHCGAPMEDLYNCIVNGGD